MFRLLSYFSLSSAIAISLLTGLLVWLYQSHATSQLVASAERHNVAMARVISNSVWPSYSRHLNNPAQGKGSTSRLPEQTAALHQKLLKIVDGLPVLKIKFYTLDGITVYSSNFSQIGEHQDANDNFQRTAREQEPTSAISFRERIDTFGGTKFGIDVVESYVPVRSPDGRTTAIAELYYDVSASVAEIHEVRWLAAQALILAFGALYVVLLLLVYRAESILRRQYEELQSALVKRENLTVLGKLTATVGHELRNPLSALRNATFIIRDLTGGSGELERHFAAAERSIQRCDNIIQDLLEFNRERRLDCTQIDLSRWVEQICEEQLIPDNVTLIKDLQDPGPVAMIDDERLRRAIINLIENAVQAHRSTGKSGQVTVVTRSDGANAVIAVSDDGEGISPDDLPKIFEPLFTTKNNGTGLGLPTVKNLVEQHYGAISVQSSPGSGSQFTIKLPAIELDVQKAA